MISRIIKPLSCVKFLSMCPKLSFSTNLTDNVSKLRQKLDEQIEYQKNNKPNLNEYESDIIKIGWQIKTEGTLIEATKKVGQYTLNIVFHARTPPQEDQNEVQQGQEDQSNMNGDYCEITAYIKKSGMDNKWLCVDFAVTNESSNISMAYFMSDSEVRKIKQTRGFPMSKSYMGPQMSSLDEQLFDNLGHFLQNLGVDTQSLKLFNSYSIAFEHTFYVQWLQDVQSIL